MNLSAKRCDALPAPELVAAVKRAKWIFGSQFCLRKDFHHGLLGRMSIANGESRTVIDSIPSIREYGRMAAMEMPHERNF